MQLDGEDKKGLYSHVGSELWWLPVWTPGVWSMLPMTGYTVSR